MQRILLLSALASISLISGPDNKTDVYPTDFFRSPVNQAILLSGTFGELRSNHFHSGIDIKGAIGQTLYAAADGYVARIRVEKSGYGKVLYLQHPNGYTTVYAHMNNFTPELEQYIKDYQYQKEQFEVELFPEKDRFFFRKGEVIGAMGTTGASSGPHLHFEIRDSGSEKPINPLLFGLKVADKRPPRMHQLKIYFLNDKLETIKTENLDLVKNGDGYGIQGDMLTIGAWRAGFGLKVYDHMDNVTNWNGIYNLQMYVDDDLVYDFEMEKFSFSETRFLNAHLDYEEQMTRKSYFNRCYRLPGNRLSVYNQLVNEGVVKLYENKPSKITMIARDVAGNKSKLEFWVKRGEIEKTEPEKYNYLLPYNQENVVENYNLRLHFPKGAFYEDLYLQYENENENSADIFSAVHSVHDYQTPVHLYFDISIRPTLLPDHFRDKAFVAYCGKGNRIFNYGGKWVNGNLTAKVRNLGDFFIMVDNSPPVIQPLNFREDMRGIGKMTFRISDDYPSAGRAKGITYRATVDGKWIVMEYDEKNDLLIHHFDGRLSPGKHQLRLVVKDGLDNSTEFEANFRR